MVVTHFLYYFDDIADEFTLKRKEKRKPKNLGCISGQCKHSGYWQHIKVMVVVAVVVTAIGMCSPM